MPSHLQTLSEYLSKIKKPSPPQLNLHSKTLSTSTNWFLRGCKHTKPPSISVDPEANDNDEAATLCDVDWFLQENFKSLYQKEFVGNESNNIKNKDSKDVNERSCDICLFDSPRFRDLPSNLCGSNRFFIAHGSSRSLIEATLDSVATSDDNMASSSNSKSTRSIGDEAKEDVGPDDFITILMYSPSPYNDFKKSMQEMIEARLQHNGEVNWEFVEELLFCYLNLNDKKSYKYILRAFVEVIVVLRENSFWLPARSRSVRTKIDKRKKMGRCKVKNEA